MLHDEHCGSGDFFSIIDAIYFEYIYIYIYIYIYLLQHPNVKNCYTQNLSAKFIILVQSNFGGK